MNVPRAPGVPLRRTRYASHRVARPALVLLAPGAGAPSTSPWMAAWAERLGTLGDVIRFDYPYMRAGRRSPDRLPVLLEAHRGALATARAGRRGPVVLAGKSMGSRVGCHLALEEAVDALVCLGYPLRGVRGELRSEVLLALRTPILFVQGTRDPLCSLDPVQHRRRLHPAPDVLERVERAERVARPLHEEDGRAEREEDLGPELAAHATQRVPEADECVDRLLEREVAADARAHGLAGQDDGAAPPRARRRERLAVCVDEDWQSVRAAP